MTSNLGNDSRNSLPDVSNVQAPTQFDIIILNWNGKEWLGGCLASLGAQTHRAFEITVVDNGSADGSQEFLAKHYHEVRVMALAENLGFCRGNNLGAFSTGHPWLLILNNDTVCAPDLLEKLAESARRYPEFQLLACKLLRLEEPCRVDNKGIHYSRSLRASQIDAGTLDSALESCREVFGSSGAALVVKRAVIQDIGLFDERFFLYHEDVDFAVRARLRGYRCLYVPQALIYHKGHGSSYRIPRDRLYYNQRNMELVVLKNIPSKLLWKYGILHLLYSLWQILRWFLRGDGPTVLRAKIDGWRLGRKFRRELPPACDNFAQFETALRGKFAGLAEPTQPGLLKRV